LRLTDELVTQELDGSVVQHARLPAVGFPVLTLIFLYLITSDYHYLPHHHDRIEASTRNNITPTFHSRHLVSLDPAH